MNPISKLRFDSLAGYYRSAYLPFIIYELGWFEAANERVLGMLALDQLDDDYVYFILGRDKKNRFRAVWVDSSIPTAEEAYRRLDVKLTEYAEMSPEEFYQGDEAGKPLDFFTPVVKAEKLNPGFNALISSRGSSPAHDLMAELMHYFEDIDGNFIKDFQTSGFDARLWELYLYAVFTELGYNFDRKHKVPDFHLQGPRGDFFVEATTVNPSSESPELNDSTMQAYFEHYVPIKFGSALFSKLNKKTIGRKRYWELPQVVGHPFLLAVQDFHSPQSMSWSSAALSEYLYGIRQVERKSADGSPEIVVERVESYKWGNKEIPSGFFMQPDAENISAVLANPGGTFSKFNRMGFLAGFGARDIRMIRMGFCYKDTVTPVPFSFEVHSPDYSETWCEGLSVYHNPRAKYPLPKTAIAEAAVQRQLHFPRIESLKILP